MVTQSQFSLWFICVLQHAREVETRRREAEERERRKQREVQMELERQLKEAESVREGFPDDNLYLQFAEMEFRVHPIASDLWKQHENIGIIKPRLNLQWFLVVET